MVRFKLRQHTEQQPIYKYGQTIHHFHPHNHTFISISSNHTNHKFSISLQKADLLIRKTYQQKGESCYQIKPILHGLAAFQ